MIKNYFTYINENTKDDYLKVGDAVEIVGPFRRNEFNINSVHSGLKGTIISNNLNNSTRCIITRWPNKLFKFSTNNPLSFFPMDVPLENLKKIDKEEYINYLKTIEQKYKFEKESRKKEYMIKMKDVDPYGEEDWDDS